MSGPTHAAHVVDRFGARAQAYVASAVHAAGADADRIGALMRDRRGARALGLGCGGGHVIFAAAAAGARVTADDLSRAMPAGVGTEAARHGPPASRPGRAPRSARPSRTPSSPRC